MKTLHVVIVPIVVLLVLFQYTKAQYSKNDASVEKRVLLEDNYYTIINKLNALTKEVETLKKQATTTQHVAFEAKLTTPVTGHAHYIVYNNVTLNIGNAYNPNHGNFVAPVNGTYLFALYACAADANDIYLQLFVNAEPKGTLVADDSVWVDCNSRIYITKLVVGDDVYVKQHPTNGVYLAANEKYDLPTFSGFLLHPY